MQKTNSQESIEKPTPEYNSSKECSTRKPRIESGKKVNGVDRSRYSRFQMPSPIHDR